MPDARGKLSAAEIVESPVTIIMSDDAWRTMPEWLQKEMQYFRDPWTGSYLVPAYRYREWLKKAGSRGNHHCDSDCYRVAVSVHVGS